MTYRKRQETEHEAAIMLKNIGIGNITTWHVSSDALRIYVNGALAAEIPRSQFGLMIARLAHVAFIAHDIDKGDAT